ncbi:type VII secretion protein EccCa [Solwaraspora sp. WMMD406]|uniref:type VII secretion protein EccCa n=1 Tax=Solwaraspora sp. WMMD406 TaxID=3016095 RepID=UPI00241678B2|nr:type VII secretion protein EccCa [Solwaraspora sp. WMMD406]MDG4765072.1 type VII secretion protein EccCa [Solwaraspora sp. WMMD406]
MSTIPFRRPARRKGPELPTGDITVQEPPSVPEFPTGNMGMVLMYLPMAIASSVVILLFVSPGNAVLMYMAAGLMVVATLGMLVGQLGQTAKERKQRMRGERRDYFRYLSQLRRLVRKMVDRQRESMAFNHPAPDTLWSVAISDRLWERRAHHADFAEVRAGLGVQRFSARITPAQTRPVEDLEPLAAQGLRRFVQAYTTVAQLPFALYLRGFRALRLTGDPEAVRGLVTAVLAQLITLHGPDDLRLVICASPHRSARWDWAKWTPHTMSSLGAGAAPLFCTDLAAVESALGESFTGRNRFQVGAVPAADEPFVVVLVDGVEASAGNRFAGAGYRNAILIDLDGHLAEQSVRDLLHLEVTATEVTMMDRTPDGRQQRTVLGRPDQLSTADARALARTIAAFRPSDSAEVAEPATASISLASLLGLGDLDDLDVHALWAARGGNNRLRVPIGMSMDGAPVDLDIKESALGGFGPHGMVIGATGSGKSELLRTLVLSLAVTHSSETLNFVLIDFKGGATFLGCDQLPHTSAVITNLADELPLVARMYDALHGELIRRQELLRSAGNFSSVHDYNRARAAGTPLDPLPSLFVVVDEFSELLAAHREFIELFVMIGRLGRSLGVHLLLASQRLDDGRINQLETHLSYRIGLRTFSASESRAVLGVPDAYELPSAPGNGYLRFDVTSMVRFKAAYVSGPYVRPVSRKGRPTEVASRAVLPFEATPRPAGWFAEHAAAQAKPDGPETPDIPEGESALGEESLLGMIIAALRDQGPPAHQVWLPPLAESPTLDQLLPALVFDPARGLGPDNRDSRLAAPIGVVDRPFDQIRELLVADVNGPGGHIGVAGTAQTGKSTLLRTLICSLSLSNTPRQVQFYCLDFGGGTLGGLAGLPHVGAVAARTEIDRVGRIVSEIGDVLARRERLFAEHRVDSMAAYRRERDAGRFDDDEYGDVFLVVDGWATLRQEFEALEPAVRTIAGRGLNYGVHLVVTAARWSEIHMSVRDQLGTRLELRMGEAIDSAVDIRLAATVPVAAGRGLTTEKAHFLVALPRIDGQCDPTDLTVGQTALVETVSAAWSGPSAPGLRVLPDTLPADTLPTPDGDVRIPIGVAEGSLATVWHDFDVHSHLSVLGDAESGKTNLVRLVLRAITSRYTSDEAKVILVDLRRNLLEWLPEEYRIGYAVTAASARQTLADVAPALRDRMPGPEVRPEQLRHRQWWSGPQVFLVFDDYDLLASSVNSPIDPLLDLLAYGADIGLHVVVARGAAGSGRTGMDPLLRKLGELNVPDLMLSCPPMDTPAGSPVKGRVLPAGRAQLVTRRGATLIQTAYLRDGATG